MYLFEPIYLQYYEITNNEDFIKYLDKQNITNIKHLLKQTYQEQVLQDSLTILRDRGLTFVEGSGVSLKDTIEFFKKYIEDRFGEDVYKKIIFNFDRDFDFRMRTIANPSMLN